MSRILVVDDSLTVREHLAAAFRAAGFTVTLAGTLAAARAALAAAPVDVVVLDVILPDGDGVDLLAELRAAPATASLPVILLSSRDQVADRIRGHGVGADDYAAKPYRSDYLVARAEALIAGRSGVASATGGHRILVIEDSLTFREALRSSLTEAGHEAFVAESGSEGLRMAARLRPDLVIVDGMLPDLDGATVVQRLRLDPALGGVPCILLTASLGRAQELEALSAGVDAFLRKDQGVGVILARVTALLRGRSPRTHDERAASMYGPQRVLAVDDSPTFLHELAHHLRGDGYEVALARSGDEALELLGATPVDCVLLDMMMPGISGEETCRRIKSTPEWRDIPVLFLTSRDEREATVEGINAGADDYIPKSSDFEVVRARLRAQLRRRHFELEARRVHDDLHRRELEAAAERSGRQLAESRAALLAELELKNDALEEKNHELEQLTARVEARARDLARELTESEDRFGRLVEASGDGLLVVDRGGAVRYANGAAAELLGHVPSPGAPWPFAPLDPEVHAEVALPGIAGCARCAEVRVSPTLWEGEDAYLVALRDVTERKRVEEALRGSEAQLLHAQRLEAVGQLAGGVAHDFNNLLTAIAGYGSLLLEGLDPDRHDQREQVAEVLRASERASALTRQLLAFGCRQVIQPRPLDLRDVLAGVYKLLEHLLGADVRLVTRAPSTLSPVEADAGQIEQVLVNLAVNARDAMSQGGVLTFTFEEIELAGGARDVPAAELSGPADVSTPPGSYVSLSVADTGDGMAPEVASRIFEPFFTTKEMGKGTGLGLSTAYGIARQHGGQLMVESALGVGSTFTLLLPRVAVTGDEGRVAAGEPTGAAPGGERAPAGGARPAAARDEAVATVLLVEDQEQVRELVARVLRRAGYAVVEAGDGEAALALELPAIDLLISDVVMPGVGGIELYERLARRLPELKVMFISGYHHEEMERRGVLTERTSFLEKPFSPTQLVDAVQLALEA